MCITHSVINELKYSFEKLNDATLKVQILKFKKMNEVDRVYFEIDVSLRFIAKLITNFNFQPRRVDKNSSLAVAALV